MENKKDFVLVSVYLVIVVILFLLPTGFQKNIYYNAENVKAKVLEVDNSGVYEVGLYKQGEQNVKVKFINGSKEGKDAWGVNLLSGSMGVDKLFVPGEIAYALVEKTDQGEISHVNVLEHYRIGGEILIVATFGVLLIIFSGIVGIRTIMSFLLVILSILKLLIPLLLKGYNPLVVSLLVGTIISVFTIFLVSGVNNRSYSALLGTLACSLITFLVSLIFKKILYINGTELPWAESLLYSGMNDLDLAGIMQGAIYLSCLGAILDLAVDIAASLEEIRLNKPDISSGDLVKSGLSIGKTIVGSQTTTLLLAYMGSYISIMMVYMVQGTPIINILTTKAIASEILFTFVGCIGLVFVAPLTSFMYLFFRNRRVESKA